MKKFSKIFSRRRHGGHGHDGGAWETGSLESALDFHQLTSKRWRGSTSGVAGMNRDPSGGYTLKRKTFGTGTSHILADGSEGANPPCERCKGIDFARLLDWQPGDARPWVSLSHCLRLQEEEKGDEITTTTTTTTTNGEEETGPCPWCVFFNAMINSVPDGDEPHDANGKDEKAMKGKFTPYLRIRLAFERLGGGEKHGLGKSVLFEVTTRNRSLPWGYIVKAVPATLESEAESDTNSEAQENGHADVTAAYVGSKGDGGGRDAPKSIHGRIVTPLLDPELPKCWIDFCKETHSDGLCNVKSGAVVVPNLRLIDCEEERVVLAKDLESTPDGEKTNGESKSSQLLEYVTLSYVAGSSPDDIEGQATPNEEVDNSSSGSGLPAQIPRLISDAITVTKRLGFRYLWVDRYCMPASGGAGQSLERREQLDLMGQIFGRSAVTIIVAAGDSINSGIPGISAPREEQLSLKAENAVFTTSLLRPDLEVASSKWQTRAWTYQEGLLSTRRLIFTVSQIYFQCQTLHCHESISLPLKHAPGLNLGRVFPPAGEVFQTSKFKDYIKTYLVRSISDDSQRLDAFRGLLYEYSQRQNRPIDNFMGLPLFHPDDFSSTKVVSQTDRLVVALGWIPDRTVPSYSSSQDDLLGSQVIDPYRLSEATDSFPSWTWLAWQLRRNNNNNNDNNSTTSIATATTNGHHQKIPPTPKHAFNFHLVRDTSPVVGDVSAAPGTEISVGFADGMVLSWEIDGDAIARKADRITFLRMKTYCFNLTVKKSALAAKDSDSSAVFALVEPGAATLGKAAADSIEAWMCRTGVPAADDIDAAATITADETKTVAAAKEKKKEQEEYHLTGILLSGRNWKAPKKHNHHITAAAAAASAAGHVATATVLICGQRNWDPNGKLVRLGSLSITYEGLLEAATTAAAPTSANATSVTALMKGIDSGGGEKKDLKVQLREVDIY